MKIRHYGALTSAFLITLSTGAAQASDCAAACDCPPKAVHHTSARPAPAHAVRKHADAEYAQSFYDYHSASRVSEVLVRRVAVAPPQAEPWRVAPNDAKIRFRPYDVGAESAPPRQVALNDNDFNGGVGEYQGAGGGGGTGFEDGYGQVHFNNGGVGQNGPTYNNYNESFSSGGFAQGGYGTERTNIWHGYNLQTGPSNGY